MEEAEETAQIAKTLTELSPTHKMLLVEWLITEGARIVDYQQTLPRNGEKIAQAERAVRRLSYLPPTQQQAASLLQEAERLSAMLEDLKRREIVHQRTRLKSEFLRGGVWALGISAAIVSILLSLARL